MNHEDTKSTKDKRQSNSNYSNFVSFVSSRLTASSSAISAPLREIPCLTFPSIRILLAAGWGGHA